MNVPTITTEEDGEESENDEEEGKEVEESDDGEEENGKTESKYYEYIIVKVKFLSCRVTFDHQNRYQMRLLTWYILSKFCHNQHDIANIENNASDHIYRATIIMLLIN